MADSPPTSPVDAPGAERVAASDGADAQWTALAAAMTRAVRRQCPAWLSAQAPDIAQAALMKVMAAERKAGEPRTLSPYYLHRAAHSALVDEIRRRRSRPEVSLDEAPDEDSAPRIEPQAGGTPETQASLRQLGDAIRDCLRAIIRDRRLAVTLHLQGHSVPEAARLLNWDAKRTENLVYRGLADLRQCLTRKGHRP